MKSRRTFLVGGLCAASALPAVALPFSASADHLVRSPFCGKDYGTTPWQPAGEYFLEGAPERVNLADDDPGGVTVELFGSVFDSHCHPVIGARIDIWQSDHFGQYDEEGFKLRGHQVTGPSGTYCFVTVIPAPHDDDPPHFHTRVIGPAGKRLTTNVYLPSDGKGGGGKVDPSLIAISDAWGEIRRVRFDFVL
ncbi:MAG: hypothetical protein P1U88_11870 [Thalassobaculaceae bacterium]|nr:hypothetical protein [Thalassobaculaceae bacterium]